MTIIAHNSNTLAHVAETGANAAVHGRAATNAPLVIAWSCTRKSARENHHRMLERVQFLLRLESIEGEHATMEAWLEADGLRTRTIHPARRLRCQITDGAGLRHIDVRDDEGESLATLSLTSHNGDARRLVYAQTPLLSRAGFAVGGYDTPALRANEP